MTEYLDHYCERTAPGLWGEPLNFTSNLGFIIAAYFLWRWYKRNRFALPGWNTDLDLLLILMVIIGFGSSFWHLYANPLALWADRVPILLFINLYLLSCLFRVFQCDIRNAVVIFILYHICNTAAMLVFPLETLNRSIFYLPTWVFLGAISFVIWRRHSTGRLYYFWSLLVFTIAIAFRTIDLFACDVVPTGTHFIWHLLVSLTLYFLMMALMRVQKGEPLANRETKVRN